MKIGKLLIAGLVLALGLVPGTSRAELKSGVLTVSPMLGGIMMEGDQNVDDDMAYSLGVGYNLTKALGLEAVLAGAANLDEDKTDRSVDLLNYRLDALYHFMTDRPLVPYAAVGIGGYDLGGDKEFMANYGVGLLYFIAENVALRADVRHLAVFNETPLDHNLLYTAGFKFQFAEQKPPVKAVAPAPAPVVKDSDGDGVPDHLDKCPGTPKGRIVDADGCELKLTLHINFDFDKAEIKPEFKSELDKAATFIRQNSQVPYILLAGHTDSIGEADYNQNLSERRAAAVRQALISDYGVDPGKLIAKGYGQAQPIADNATEEGRYQNRRVEVICCAVLPE